MDWFRKETEGGEGYSFTVDLPIDGSVVFSLIPTDTEPNKYLYQAHFLGINHEIGQALFSKYVDKDQVPSFQRKALIAIINMFHSQELLLNPQKLGEQIQ